MWVRRGEEALTGLGESPIRALCHQNSVSESTLVVNDHSSKPVQKLRTGSELKKMLLRKRFTEALNFAEKK